MTENIPSFVVVGRTNEGKSSIVSTLVADDTVRIAQEPGTTQEARQFRVKVDGQVVFVLIDTPGFENARRTLKWLKKRDKSPDKRVDLIREFVDEHRDDPDFRQEVRLLEPVLNGAGILYVVDGSHPFRRNYEAEIEILRWTSRGSMALINDKDQGQYVDEWKKALPQWFSLVRYFNAHQSSFRNRLDLLLGLREIYEDWREPITKAVQMMAEDWKRRRRRAAQTIAALIIKFLTHSQQIHLPADSDVKDKKAELEEAFHSSLRTIETQSRRDVEALYDHTTLKIEESEMDKPIFERDLFAESVWNVLGLTPTQLIMAGAATGAVVGGTLDVFLGGASFMTGAVVGAVSGAGLATFLLYQRYERATVVGLLSFFSRQPKTVTIGPHRNPQLPWIVLDRALLHTMTVCNRAHSNREILKLDKTGDKEGLVSRFDSERRSQLAKLFEKIRKAEPVPTELRESLENHLATILSELSDDLSSL